MDTGSFTVYIKTENIYVDSAKDDDKRFDSLSYESDGQLSNQINEGSVRLKTKERFCHIKA